MNRPCNPIAKCALCGFPFKRQRETGVYCTNACRKRAQRVRKGELTQEEAEKLAREQRAEFSRASVEAETARLNALGKSPQ